jgi:hypothetical protein
VPLSPSYLIWMDLESTLGLLEFILFFCLSLSSFSDIYLFFLRVSFVSLSIHYLRRPDSYSCLKVLTVEAGRAMAQAVSRRPLTAKARVRCRVSPCEICGQSDTGTGFSPSTSVFPCQFHSTGTPLHGKTKKQTNHLHHRVAQ